MSGKPFKPGDKVRIYGSSQIGEECWRKATGIVDAVCTLSGEPDPDWVNVKIIGFGSESHTFHRKQLRRLVKRKRSQSEAVPESIGETYCPVSAQIRWEKLSSRINFLLQLERDRRAK